jgi:UDP-N-acetylglucosamine 2-epimerase (non-hydrolysing)
VPKEKIFMVGNLMIDSLVANLETAKKSLLTFSLLNRNRIISIGKDFQQNNYGAMTFHRPNNVDNRQSLKELVEIWGKISEKIPLIFPVHPRTYKNIQNFGLQNLIDKYENLFFIEPLGYLQFINLVKNAKFALTDSGGIQEETTYLNIPCLTIRPNTERPVTIWEGSNKLIKINEIETEIDLILAGKGKSGRVPKFWDGHTAQRIIKIIEKL